MSKQEMFDAVVTGLASQAFRRSLRVMRSPSEDRDALTCALRGAPGFRCAIGWLIPDDLYDQSLEMQNVLDEDMRAFLIEHIGCRNPTNLNFFVDMQIAHDNGRFPEEMIQELRKAAIKHELSDSVLRQLTSNYDKERRTQR